MNEPSQISLLLTLIEAQGKQISELSQIVREGHDRSSESRGRIHERIDEVAERLGRLDGSIAVLGQADAQVRTELQTVADKVDEQARAMAPAVTAWNEFGTLMKTGRRISLIFGISGITLVGWITGLGEWVYHAIRSRF
jgi:transposase